MIAFTFHHAITTTTILFVLLNSFYFLEWATNDDSSYVI